MWVCLKIGCTGVPPKNGKFSRYNDDKTMDFEVPYFQTNPCGLWTHYCLVVTGTMEWIMTFPSYWEWNNHPNWLIFFRGVETNNQTNMTWRLHVVDFFQCIGQIIRHQQLTSTKNTWTFTFTALKRFGCFSPHQKQQHEQQINNTSMKKHQYTVIYIIKTHPIFL